MKSIQLHRCIYPTGTVHKNVQVSIRELTQPIHKIGSQSHGIGKRARRTLLSECLRMSDPPQLGWRLRRPLVAQYLDLLPGVR